MRRAPPSIAKASRRSGTCDKHTLTSIPRLQFARRPAVTGLMFPTSSVSFRAQYQAVISSCAIQPDAAQAKVADAFAALEQRLDGYKPPRKQGLLGRLFADKDEAPPRGLYIFGEVGRGKTM